MDGCDYELEEEEILTGYDFMEKHLADYKRIFTKRKFLVSNKNMGLCPYMTYPSKEGGAI